MVNHKALQFACTVCGFGFIVGILFYAIGDSLEQGPIEYEDIDVNLLNCHCNARSQLWGTYAERSLARSEATSCENENFEHP